MEAFEILKKKADEHKRISGSNLLCNLIFDEMSIRRHAQWNAAKSKFDGFVDLGKNVSDQEDLPLAKDAIVFLISGATDDFKLPIAYFLTNGLNGEDRAVLTNEILVRLSEIGLEIIAIIFDGLPANLAMCRLFGADFDNGKAYFLDPANNNRKIYTILDPPHMLKLSRNCIGSRNLVDSEGGIISWKYIQFLYDAQLKLPWNLGNKLTKTHMLWERNKMCVKLAAQTLSNSVADSMEYLKNECEQFKDAGPTIKYIRTINDIFDIMNSTKAEGAIGFKQAISSSNSSSIFQCFQAATEYLIGLQVESEKKSVFSSTIYTPFIGFLNNMTNFKCIYEDYVEAGRADMLITHRFSQDLIETFFGSIRSMGGMKKIEKISILY